MVSFRKSEADAILRANVDGTRNLAQAARAAGWSPAFTLEQSLADTLQER
jgi:nucleoside-diphosphate-sugar epimerase